MRKASILFFYLLFTVSCFAQVMSSQEIDSLAEEVRAAFDVPGIAVAVIKDGKVFARGSADDKGQFYMHIKALEILSKTNTMTTNIKFLIEGEEEVGSPNLETFVKNNKELLKADVILVSDSSLLSMENPSLDIGVRGLTYIQLEVTGANRDLHSGTYGGAVANPITILAQMIASCHDKKNHITIPGFYDDVLVPTKDEKKLLRKCR